MKYWIGVVSKEHVKGGVEGGFAQVCHGKKTPLSRLKKGDWLIYYSPKMSMEGSVPLKAFTALGKVKTGEVYQVAMTSSFHPYRLDIAYEGCKDVPIEKLKTALSFTQAKSWGMQLRRGLFEISKEDFEVISKAMRK